MGTWLLCIAGAYLLGSIPFGLLIGLSRGIDIRRAGSGNIGATNVGRLLGRRLGVICFALDAGKGAAAVVLGGVVLELVGRPMAPIAAAGPLRVWMWLAVAAAALAGHMFSPWLRFRGGKGVATGFGALLGMWPLLTLPALAALITWIIALRAGRYVSLASMVAALSLPAWTLLLALVAAPQLPMAERLRIFLPCIIATAALGAVVVYKHRANIARLRAGTEPRIGWGAAGRTEG
jgi:glycerol-3-phosphate acyltransferase PlsY